MPEAPDNAPAKTETTAEELEAITVGLPGRVAFEALVILRSARNLDLPAGDVAALLGQFEQSIEHAILASRGADED